MPTPNVVKNWKHRGLIHNDYMALYETYINTTHCNHCQKEFKNSRDRCMDHDHETGLFRAVVCRKCNNVDGYIKHPDGRDPTKYSKEYYEANRESILKKCKTYYETNKEALLNYQQEYREYNKELISNKQKEYRESNRENLLKKKKEYYEATKETYLQKRREKYTCGCGSTLALGNKSDHIKSLKHTTWEKTISP